MRPWLNFCWLTVAGVCIPVQVALMLATMSWMRWWRRLRVPSTSPSSWPCSERSWKVSFGRPENMLMTARPGDAFDFNLLFSFRHRPRGNHPQRFQGVRPRRKGHSQRRRVGVFFSGAQSRPPRWDPCTLFCSMLAVSRFSAVDAYILKPYRYLHELLFFFKVW